MEKLTLEERKILAMVECMLIWDLLARGKFAIKNDAIEYLIDRNMICDCSDWGCPFCQHLKDSKNPFVSIGNANSCRHCLWPGKGYVRCLYSDVYRNWSNNLTTETAKAIFDMLKSIEF